MPEVNLTLHPKQKFALACDANEIGFGGAVAGGKSYFLRAAAITFCTAIPGFVFGLFRRNEGELIDTHVNGRGGFHQILEEWVTAGFAKIITGNQPRVEFWNGSMIRMCHCSDEASWRKYLSYEFDALGIDESTTFTATQRSEIRNRLRTTLKNEDIPDQFKGRFPWICEATNPGGISAHVFKSHFVDGSEPNQIYEPSPGIRRVFIPSLLDDNPTITENDPAYEARLKANNSDARFRALRYGEWISEGAFFPEFGARNIIDPFTIPDHWYRFRAMDWGYASPFCVGWYAIAAETINHPVDGRVIKHGTLVKYREWYGIATRDDGSFIPNAGLRLNPDAVAREIKDKENGEKVSYGVLDPSAFAQDGGPSIAEQMAHEKVIFIRADNKRVGKEGAAGGWLQMRYRITGPIKQINDGKPEYDHPGLMIFNTCIHTIRTIPEIEHDERNPEDVLKKGEDHAADETRYACMSRPIAGPTAPFETSILQQPSFNDLIKANARKKRKANL